MLKKVILLVWKQSYSNLPQSDTHNFWGIGDLLRGTAAMAQRANIHNYDLVIDIHQHPVAKMLKNTRTVYSDLIDKISSTIPFIPCNANIDTVIPTLCEGSLFIIGTNQNLVSDDVDRDILDCLKFLLEPSEEMQLYIDVHRSKLPHSYVAHHYRLGDDSIVRGNVRDYNKELAMLGKYLDKDHSHVLFSDSEIFKRKAIRLYPNVTILDIRIGHLGVHVDEEKVKNSLLELHLLGQAEKIYTYTVYNSVSGFALWASKIYQCELHKILS
jgi:hypothetical protein